MSERSIELAGELGELLQQRGWRITTAESCTGGGIAAAITDIAGSSAWFASATVAYANSAKRRFLNVPEAMLREHGAVSEPVVRRMAAGALIAHRAHLAIAVSGIAGPGGGNAERPVGTVWFAWAHEPHQYSPDNAQTPDRAADTGSPRVVNSEVQVFSGDRLQVRDATVCHALQGALHLLGSL